TAKGGIDGKEACHLRRPRVRPVRGPPRGDEPFARHYRENQVRLMEAEAETFGWSTDGRGRWHCAECLALEDEHATGKAGVIPGQAELAEELGVDVEERLRRRPGFLP